jgi:hypothetical protein
LKILFDHNVPQRFRLHLIPLEVRTAREMAWDRLVNGALLRAAAAQKFSAVITIDKNIEHEQNLRTLPIAVVVLDTRSNDFPDLLPFAPIVTQLLQNPCEPILYVVEVSGNVLRLKAPRTKKTP